MICVVLWILPTFSEPRAGSQVCMCAVVSAGALSCALVGHV